VARPTESGSVRIIAGRWRGRRLHFPVSLGLRPSPDRVRETVFNWLAPYLPGSVCLDLFAGSGAFGFEALSRGARRVVLVEQEAAAVAALRENGATLAADGAVIHHGEALAYLNAPAEAFDIVFLDPPYASGLLAPCLQRLNQGNWLRPDAFVYLESPAPQPPVLPAGWELLRSKTAGQVGYHLARTTNTKEAA
jgi:16S rRNA (guanine966-N2)-methyltransferase